MSHHLFINDNNPPGARGMACYFDHILGGLLTHFGAETIVFSPFLRNYQPARHIRPLRFRGSEQISLHDRQAAIAVGRSQPKAVFSAWFTTLNTSAAQVSVVYDMIYESFPQYRAWWQTPLRRLSAERQQCLKRADKIIAISESTANDVLKFYPQTEASKIAVIPLGVDPFFFEPLPAPAPVNQRPYFLYVGFRTGHKNFKRLLTAYAHSGLAAEFDLRVISAQPFQSDETELLGRYSLQTRVHLLPRASDAKLRASYAGATAFVYPSEYEGFGLPILEALAAGTLVATSKAASMPEVGGEAPFYFDPYNTEAIAHTLQHITRLSAGERRQRVAQGVARARACTWERCQQQTIDLLQQLLV